MHDIAQARKAFLAVVNAFTASIDPLADSAAQPDEALAQRPDLAIEVRTPNATLRLLHRFDERSYRLGLLQCELQQPLARAEEPVYRELLSLNAGGPAGGGWWYGLDDEGRVVCSRPFLVETARPEELMAAASEALMLQASWQDEGLMAFAAQQHAPVFATA